MAGRAAPSCVPPAAKTAHVRGGASPLTATILGSGGRGVVLSNESDQDLCSWMPFAKRIAKAGFRVALYDYAGPSPVTDVIAVAGELRRLGASRIALVGASEGAKASIAAATKARAAAVVSLSAERFLGGYGDVLPAARGLHAPVLYLYAGKDLLASPATLQLYRATGEKDKRVVRLPGFDHGTALLAHPSLPGLIESFLADRLSPRRTASSRPSPPTLSARCGGSVRGTTFWFKTADGYRLDGAVLGSGTTGIVLATEYPADLCRWVPEALVLQKRGFRVFLFDFRGLGLSRLPARGSIRLDYASDVAAAARELRVRGAQRIYLMGASLGATASIVAAVHIRPAVVGVVSLSGESNLIGLYPNLDTVAAARRLHVWVLYLAAKYDPLTPPADVARIRTVLRFRGSRVVVYPGAYHGWDLLYAAPYRKQVDALVKGFLRR